MLSRLALSRCLQLKQITPSLVGSMRLTATSSQEGPERDLVNFPRPVRAEFPDKTRYGVFPEEWFEFLYKKTGVTGPYMLFAGLVNYCLSKEIWVVEHDFGYVFSFIIIVYGTNKLYGKQIADFLDKGVEEYEESWNSGRRSTLEALEQGVKNEEMAQWMADGQPLLIEAKRTNVKMQLEAAYRERAMQVYSEVKKRLDYQVEKQRIEQMIAQKHMVQWVVNNVLKSISGQQEKDTLKKCIVDLQALSAKA